MTNEVRNDLRERVGQQAGFLDPVLGVFLLVLADLVPEPAAEVTADKAEPIPDESKITFVSSEAAKMTVTFFNGKDEPQEVEVADLGKIEPAPLAELSDDAFREMLKVVGFPMRTFDGPTVDSSEDLARHNILQHPSHVSSVHSQFQLERHYDMTGVYDVLGYLLEGFRREADGLQVYSEAVVLGQIDMYRRRYRIRFEGQFWPWMPLHPLPEEWQPDRAGYWVDEVSEFARVDIARVHQEEGRSFGIHRFDRTRTGAFVFGYLNDCSSPTVVGEIDMVRHRTRLFLEDGTAMPWKRFSEEAMRGAQYTPYRREEQIRRSYSPYFSTLRFGLASGYCSPLRGQEYTAGVGDPHCDCGECRERRSLPYFDAV